MIVLEHGEQPSPLTRGDLRRAHGGEERPRDEERDDEDVDPADQERRVRPCARVRGAVRWLA